MAPVCTICRSDDRGEIDRALSAGMSFRDVAGRFGVGRSAAHRHATGCLALTDPGSRLRAAVDREALAEVVADTLTRARELLDREEARGHTRGVATALTTVLRAAETANRLLPDSEVTTDDPEMRALLLVLAEVITHPDTRADVMAGLRERGADDLAGAFEVVWSRRDRRAALTSTPPRAVLA